MEPASVHIRPANRDDLAAIIEIQETITQQSTSQLWRDQLAEALGRDFSRCLAAEENGQVVGFIVSEVKVGVFGAERSVWLNHVGVSPRKMGCGVGRSLGEALIKQLTEEGVERVYTAVRWDSGDMLSFFKALGFDRSNFINLTRRLI